MRTIHTLLGLLLITSAAQAQQPVKLGLKDCIEYALKHNYTVRNAKLDVQIQEAQVKQTVALALPHINGKVDYTYFNVPQRSFIDAGIFGGPKGVIEAFPFSLNYAGAANITTSQVIFDGSVWIAVKARKNVMELANNTEQITEENIRYNVLKAYNSLVIAYKQYALVKSSLGFARSMEHDLEITRNNGLAEKIEVERTSVQVNNLASDSMRIGNILTVTEQMLKYQIGMDINTPLILTDTSIEKNGKSVLALLGEGSNYDRVPEYNTLKTALTLTEYNLRRYKLAALPTLSGFWAYGSNYGSNKGGDLFIFDRYYANSTVGLSLTMPIFNGFLRQYQVREAKLNLEKSKNNIDNLKMTLDFQTATAKTSLKNSMLQVESQKRNLELSQDVLELAQKKYKAGVGSNTEVTMAQTDLLRAQNNYFSSLLDVVSAEADLKKALGLLK